MGDFRNYFRYNQPIDSNKVVFFWRLQNVISLLFYLKTATSLKLGLMFLSGIEGKKSFLKHKAREDNRIR